LEIIVLGKTSRLRQKEETSLYKIVLSSYLLNYPFIISLTLAWEYYTWLQV